MNQSAASDLPILSFVKKPVEIEAMQLRGYEDAPLAIEWINGSGGYAETVKDNILGEVAIKTLEGVMYARLGDWIIRGVEGEFYPCKPGIFEATYEVADE